MVGHQLWFILAGVSAFLTLIALSNDQNPLGYIVQTVLFLVLAISKYFCDQRGEDGKILFRRILIGIGVLVAVIYIAVMTMASM